MFELRWPADYDRCLFSVPGPSHMLQKTCPFTFSACLFLLGCMLPLQAAETGAVEWRAYDETADLDLLSRHDNARMRFRLLNSRVLDKNSLWAPFTEVLADFGGQYEALKPLVLDQSIPALQAAVAAGTLSYESLVTFYLYRLREIELDNSRYLNAVISINPAALDEARRLDQLRLAGEDVAADSLFGMPVLLKDNVGFAGLPTTAGALALQHNMTANAFIAGRLLARGAIILGKANLSEWAYFFCNDCPSGYSAMGGQTLNPYGRFRFGTGGSSSGSGAAVAANLAVAAVGSETSGSILSPASANSLVGLKPTTGSLSRSGIVPISASLDTAGPLAHSVADAVILFNAMTGFDEKDTAMPLQSADLQLIYRTVSLSGRRLGALNQLADNEAYGAAVELLEENGARIVRLDLETPDFDRFTEFLGAEMKRDLARYLADYAGAGVTINSIADLQAFNREDPEIRAPYAQGLIDMMAELALTATELEALREELQSAARTELERLFREQELDVLLSMNNRHAGLAALANYPALTIPMAYEEDGRPLGLTVIAPSFQEQELIDIGATFEALGRARRLPGYYR